MAMQKRSTDEDELINRLGAILLLPTKAESRGGFSKDHLRSTGLYSNQPKDSSSSSSKLRPSPSKSFEYNGSGPPSPVSSNNKLRDSINTTTFGRNFKASPLNPEGPPRHRNMVFQKELGSAFDTKKTPANLTTNKNLPLQISPGDVFVKDETTGLHLQEKNTELVEEWLLDISASNSSVSIKPKPKTRQGLNRRPTLFGKVNREAAANETSTEQNNSNSDKVITISRKASIKHRSRSWKAKYLAKRHLISKLNITPRNSSLPISDKVQPITPPSVSFELSRHHPNDIQINNSKFRDNTVSKYGTFCKTVLQEAIPSKDLFAIQTTNPINFNPNLLGTNEGFQHELTPTTHAKLPHFRSLLRKRRPLKVRRPSNRKVSVRCR